MREYILVTYDISDQSRLQKVYKTMRGFGDGIQKSVFLCQLSKKEEAIMRMKLDDIIKPSEDQIVIVRLGNVDRKNISNPEAWTVIGRRLQLSNNTFMIY